MTTRDYASTIEAIESMGYKVMFVSINWKRTVLNDWVNQLDKIYKNYDAQETVLAGFSYGAMTVFMAAAENNPAELWLFSLSPYFSDDMPTMKESWLKYIGKKRADVFRRLNFEKLAKKITCKTILFVGEKEVEKYPQLGRRADASKRHIKHSKLIAIPGTDHDVAAKNYIAYIKDAIS